MLRRLAQQRMTLSECRMAVLYASRAVSAVAELLVFHVADPFTSPHGNPLLPYQCRSNWSLCPVVQCGCPTPQTTPKPQDDPHGGHTKKSPNEVPYDHLGMCT